MHKTAKELGLWNSQQ